MDFKNTLIVCAVIGGIFATILVVAGVGSVESSIGHFFKDTLNGTPIEQPAASIEKAGIDLTTSANHTLAVFTGLLVLAGLMWIGSRS